MPHVWKIALIVVLVLILLTVAAVAVANAWFNRRSDKEALEVLSGASFKPREMIQPSDLAGLPYCVQKWMKRCGVVGQEKIHTVRLTQIGRMRLEEGKPWMPVQAVQYINVDEPGFIWKAKVKAAPLVNLVGRDKYYQGHGSMQFRLLGLVPVVDAKPCKEMDQGTLLRYLAEIIWYPPAALQNYITWEEIDAHSAWATMTWRGVKASMVFNFNDEGDMVSSVARRYREVNGKFMLNDWGGVARGYREFNGMRIANKSDVIWKYETGDFNWLQIEVTDVDFNPAGIY